METLRIAAGKLKNKRLEQVEDYRTRYTPAKAKNALFSILESKRPVENATFLDLCAGSGQMGFEALSRGASFSSFVDISEKSVKTLKKNVHRLACSQTVRIFKKDVMRFLNRPPESYDIIFIDPPFNEKLFDRITAKLLQTQAILSPGGRIIVESYKSFVVKKNSYYEVEDEYFYGSVKLEIMKRKG